jgi:hypothetical protein
MAALKASTQALTSGSASDDATYTVLESRIQKLTEQRDVVASEMKALLDGAAFNGNVIDERQAKKLIEQGEDLLEAVGELTEN